MQGIDLLLGFVALGTAGLSFGAAYLNYRATKNVIASKKKTAKKRFKFW